MRFKRKTKVDKYSCSKQETQAKLLLNSQLMLVINKQLDDIIKFIKTPNA